MPLFLQTVAYTRVKKSRVQLPSLFCTFRKSVFSKRVPFGKRWLYVPLNFQGFWKVFAKVGTDGDLAGEDLRRRRHSFVGEHYPDLLFS
jgi:hypothetical protein